MNLTNEAEQIVIVARACKTPEEIEQLIKQIAERLAKSGEA